MHLHFVQMYFFYNLLINWFTRGYAVKGKREADADLPSMVFWNVWFILGFPLIVHIHQCSSPVWVHVCDGRRKKKKVIFWWVAAETIETEIVNRNSLWWQAVFFPQQSDGAVLWGLQPNSSNDTSHLNTKRSCTAAADTVITYLLRTSSKQAMTVICAEDVLLWYMGMPNSD